MEKKITFITAVILLILPVFLGADTTSDIRKLAERFSIEFRNSNPDMVFKPNLGILPFANEAPEAEKHKIGEAVTGIIEDSFSRSLIFNLIDEKQREKAIKEIKFALSGLSDTDRVEVGKLEGIDYFIYGSVTQLGEQFLIRMRAVEVNTARVIFTGETSLPKYEIIDYSEKLAAAYVSPYGLGIEFNLTPFYHLDSEMSRIEGQIVEGWPLGFSLNYRITKNLVAWMGFETTTGAFRLKNTYEGIKYTEPQNMEDFNLDSLLYKKERTYFAGIIGLGYVFNITRKFNITLGANTIIGMSYLQQFYYFGEEGETAIEHGIETQDITLLLVSPIIKIQYYITPRMALHTSYSYGYQIPIEDELVFFYGPKKSNRFEELYKLNPSIDPKGDGHFINFTGHRIVAGIGFYF